MARLLRMPEVAASSVEAVLAAWPVAEDVQFAQGDAIAVVETEKAVVDVAAETDGVILRLLVPAGASVEVGTPMALIGDLGEVVTDIDALLARLGVVPDDMPEQSSVEPTVTEPVPAHVAPTSPAAERPRIFTSPLARRLAQEAGLPLDSLSGTGRGGRIVRRDVDRAVRAGQPYAKAGPQVASTTTPMGPASGADGAAFVDIPHTRMRRAIAARLIESTRDVPQFSVRGTARVDRLLRLRARLNETGVPRVSVNDLIVMAAARSHALEPAMNVIWTVDAVRSFGHVDLAVAVATDRGLVAPVLRRVEQMRLSEIASATADLAARARSGTLRQDELEGGTLIISNLGSFGTEEFTAIINPPQSAILAVGAARREPLVHKGRLTVGRRLTLTLSVDHRPIDGAVAARWMSLFLSLLEDPARMLV